jgi:hypothetical protein
MNEESLNAVNESERVLDTLKANGTLERLLQKSLVLLKDDVRHGIL